MIGLELGWWKKYKRANAHARMVEQFGKIKSPKVMQLMLEMATASKAKAAASAWFAAHADATKSFLQKAAKSSNPTAETAKALLAKIE